MSVSRFSSLFSLLPKEKSVWHCKKVRRIEETKSSIHFLPKEVDIPITIRARRSLIPVERQDATRHLPPLNISSRHRGLQLFRNADELFLLKQLKTTDFALTHMITFASPAAEPLPSDILDAAEDVAELASLQQTMHRQIPCTVQLRIRMKLAQDRGLLLTAPLVGNTNHQGSAFAGSLNTIAALGGWAFVSMLLRRQRITGNVLLQDSQIRYLRPVFSDFQAFPELDQAGDLDKFLKVLWRKGKSRVQVRVSVADACGTAATFSGRYVASLGLTGAVGGARDDHRPCAAVLSIV